MDDDFEITFSANFKIPKLEDIPLLPKNTSWGVKDSLKLKGVHGGSGSIFTDFSGDDDHICSCIRFSNDYVQFIFGPTPQLKELKATVFLSENEAGLSLHMSKKGSCYLGRFNFSSELAQYLENAVLALEVRYDSSSQLVLVKREVILESRKLNKESVDFFRHDKEFTDVIFAVKGKKIKAHKAILASHSEYFRQMFSSGMMECQTNVVTVPDCDPPIFRLALRMLYGGFSLQSRSH